MVASAKAYRKPLTPDRSAKDSGHRFYSAEISRWLSRDPIEENGGINLYGFVGNRVPDRIDTVGVAPLANIPQLEDGITFAGSAVGSVQSTYPNNPDQEKFLRCPCGGLILDVWVDADPGNGQHIASVAPELPRDIGIAVEFTWAYGPDPCCPRRAEWKQWYEESHIYSQEHGHMLSTGQWTRDPLRRATLVETAELTSMFDYPARNASHWATTYMNLQMMNFHTEVCPSGETAPLAEITWSYFAMRGTVFQDWTVQYSVSARCNGDAGP